MNTIALCNQKGGVGKSTLTYHLAEAISRMGARVLVVDADPQGNLSFALAETPIDEGAEGLADVLSARTNAPVRRAVVPSHFENVDLLPTAGEGLAFVRDELVVAGAGREARLRAALAAVADSYDYCLIDCPPSLDQLTINALVAAQEALIVTHAQLFSAHGLTRLLSNIGLVQENYNPNLSVLGVAINQLEAHTNAARYWLEEVHNYATKVGVEIVDPPIPKRVKIADAVEQAEALRDAELATIFDTIAKTITKKEN